MFVFEIVNEFNNVHAISLKFKKINFIFLDKCFILICSSFYLGR